MEAVGNATPPWKAYRDALVSQLDSFVKKHFLEGREAIGIHFGGGTPSLMPPEFFVDVVQACRNSFSFLKNVEIGCEVNPKSATADWLSRVFEAGVNRLSVGIQSFESRHLTFLDRDHTAFDIDRVMRDAKHIGFPNISCDLMFGIPTQTLSDVRADIQRALSFEPTHLSAYQLTYEPGTRLYQHPTRTLISDDDVLDAMWAIEEMLCQKGMQHYEISNYAYPGCESRHNLNYWNYGEYLGLGSGSVSFLRGMRWHTTRNTKSFLEGDFSEKAVDCISHRAAMGEFCFLGLRKVAGFSKHDFEKMFRVSFDEVYGDVEKKLVERAWISVCNDVMSLTRRGVELSNEVFREFI